MPQPMTDCLSDDQVAELLSGPLAEDQTVNAHLDPFGVRGGRPRA